MKICFCSELSSLVSFQNSLLEDEEQGFRIPESGIHGHCNYGKGQKYGTEEQSQIYEDQAPRLQTAQEQENSDERHLPQDPCTDGWG